MLDIELLDKLEEYNEYRYFCCSNYIPFDINNDFEKILKARYNKVNRVKQHFVYLYHNRLNTYFLTFTFDDDTLEKCDRTKKDLIKHVLNNFDKNSLIILNIDFGNQTEREHYHCIFGTDKKDDLSSFLESNYPCFSKTLKIRHDFESLEVLSKYINKLSNHAVKRSTRNFRVYYNFKGYGNFTRDCPEVRNRYYEDKKLVGLT